MSLREAIRHVFGIDAPALRNASDIQHRALEFNPSTWNGDSSSCAHYVQYAGREDVIDLAIEPRHFAPDVADVFHFLVDAVLAAVPFRHEAFLVEVAPPHRLWYVDNGRWRLSADSLFAKTRTQSSDEAPFRQRLSRAKWLFYLFPNAATWITAQDIRDGWRADGSPTRENILSTWDASSRGCADTMAALWGGYFTGGTTKTLAAILEAADAHTAGAVRSSARMIRELDDGHRGKIHDEIRSNLGRFWKT